MSAQRGGHDGYGKHLTRSEVYAGAHRGQQCRRCHNDFSTPVYTISTMNQGAAEPGPSRAPSPAAR